MDNHHHHRVQASHVLPSPNSTSSSNSSSSSSSNPSSNGAAAAPPAAPSTPMSTPRSIDSSPYPTTFVQADTSSFKQVVQMLTGSAGIAAGKRAAAAMPPPLHKNPLPPAAKATMPKKPAFKLYERRNSLKNLKMISPLIPSFVNSNATHSPMGSPARRQQHQPEILSPSVLDFPSLALSPVTPLILDPFNRTPHSGSSTPSSASAEARAIAAKGFYLHPSPRSADPPRLLPLFPETSPRLAAASAAATT